MASGNQTYSGICADFPVAPTKKNRPTNVMNGIPTTEPGGRFDNLSYHSGQLAEGHAVVSGRLAQLPEENEKADQKPKSPIRLTTKAFMPALALLRS